MSLDDLYERCFYYDKQPLTETERAFLLQEGEHLEEYLDCAKSELQGLSDAELTREVYQAAWSYVKLNVL